MNIVFRVDSSSEIGAGHLVRCIALALRLKKLGHHCIFISRVLNGSIFELIIDNEFDLIKFNLIKDGSRVSIEIIDAEATIRLISDQNVEALILDSYELGSIWETKVRSVIDNLLVIDDSPTRIHNCRILVDPNSGNSRKEYMKYVKKDCTILAGGKYALLRKQFLEVRRGRKNQRLSSNDRKLLIMLGGMADEAIILRILTCIEKIKIVHGWIIYVVVGYDPQRLEEIQNFAKKSPLNIHIFERVDDMARLMVGCNLIISAAGSAVWEICCLGVPSALICLADNQRRIFKYVVHMGGASALHLKTLERDIRRLFEDMSLVDHIRVGNSAAKIIDGLGVNRVAGRLLNIS